MEGMQSFVEKADLVKSNRESSTAYCPIARSPVLREKGDKKWYM